MILILNHFFFDTAAQVRDIQIGFSVSYLLLPFKLHLWVLKLRYQLAVIIWKLTLHFLQVCFFHEKCFVVILDGLLIHIAEKVILVHWPFREHALSGVVERGTFIFKSLMLRRINQLECRRWHLIIGASLAENSECRLILIDCAESTVAHLIVW